MSGRPSEVSICTAVKVRQVNQLAIIPVFSNLEMSLKGMAISFGTDRMGRHEKAVFHFEILFMYECACPLFSTRTVRADTPSGSIRSIEALKAHFEVELTGIFPIV